MRGLELNADMIDKINGAFGTKLGRFSVKGKKQSRSVTVTRRFTENDIERIAALSPADIQRASTAAGAKPSALLKLVADLTTLKEPGPRALRIQSYVASTGLHGMGALSRALGDTAGLEIKSSSSAYSDPVGRAAELAFEFAEPIAPDVSKNDVTRRFKEVELAREKVVEGFKEALDDPLLTQAERYAIRERLDGARRQLERVMDVGHLSDEQRAALYDRLDAGWTTGRQQRLMALLRPEARAPA